MFSTIDEEEYRRNVFLSSFCSVLGDVEALLCKLEKNICRSYIYVYLTYLKKPTNEKWIFLSIPPMKSKRTNLDYFVNFIRKKKFSNYDNEQIHTKEKSIWKGSNNIHMNRRGRKTRFLLLIKRECRWLSEKVLP